MTEKNTVSAERNVVDRASEFTRKAAGVYANLSLSAKVSLLILVGLVVVAVGAPIFAPYNPIKPNYDAVLQPPSEEHLMGTDLTGRDIFSRVVFGTRVSLLVGIGAVTVAILIGVPVGSIGGYYGGWLDELLMRSMDIAIAFPALVLALAVIGTLGPSLVTLIIVIGIIYSPQYARLIHGQILSIREEEFVEAAKNTGLNDRGVLFKHMLPNAFTPILVQATFHIALAIILEASLSFLGLGVQPPTPTWGVMISNGRNYLPAEWWISTFPGFAILVTVLAFNLLGDGLRDELDPRSATETTTEDPE